MCDDHSDLRQEMNDLRGDLREFRAEMRGSLRTLTASQSGETALLRREIDDAREERSAARRRADAYPRAEEVSEAIRLARNNQITLTRLSVAIVGAGSAGGLVAQLLQMTFG